MHKRLKGLEPSAALASQPSGDGGGALSGFVGGPHRPHRHSLQCHAIGWPCAHNCLLSASRCTRRTNVPSHQFIAFPRLLWSRASSFVHHRSGIGSITTCPPDRHAAGPKSSTPSAPVWNTARVRFASWMPMCWWCTIKRRNNVNRPPGRPAARRPRCAERQSTGLARRAQPGKPR